MYPLFIEISIMTDSIWQEKNERSGFGDKP
jgi:hypothetical protein